MRCPACRHPALEHDQVCSRCGFSLEALAQKMGVAPTLTVPLADQARVMTSHDRRQALDAAQTLHRRFPQLSFAAVLAELSPEVPLPLHAFWLFNRGSLFSAVERGGDNHGVLLLVDPETRQAVSMIGYGLEPFVNPQVLEVCLAAASASLMKGLWGAAIGAFVRELERQLLTVAEGLPRAFGYDEELPWTDASAPVPHGNLAKDAVARDPGDLY
ncbi:MAG TPA: hypothetical protein VGE29_09295 [Prosthecobacter sp.]